MGLKTDAPPLELTYEDVLDLQRVRHHFEFEGFFAFEVLAALQLALRHPDFPEPMRGHVQAFAEALANVVSVSANLARVAKAGFDPKEVSSLKSKA